MHTQSGESMGPLVVFEIHMQWLKPMQKTGIGGNGLQFSLQTGIDRAAPDFSDLIEEQASCLKYQQDVQKRGKKHLQTLQPVSTPTDPPFQLVKVFLLPELFFFAKNSV